MECKEALDWASSEAKAKFNSPTNDPSIGGPATQTMMNKARVPSRNVTLGVPYLCQDIKAAVNAETPSLTVYLEPAAASNGGWMKTVQPKLAHTTLRTDKGFVDVVPSIPYDKVTAMPHCQSN